MKFSMRKGILSVAIVGAMLGSSLLSVDAYNLKLSVYKQGVSHNDVKMIQEVLKEKGYLKISNTTTYFGSATKAAVIKFQEDSKLSADGIVGKTTILKLFQGSLDNQITQAVNRGTSVNRIVSEKYTTTSLNMRKGAGTNYKAVLVVPKGVKVGVVSTSGNWVKVNYNNSIGYVSGKFLADAINVSSPSQSPSRGVDASREKPVALDWWSSAQHEVPRGATFVVEDFKTGVKFNITRTYGTNHADVEATSLDDTQKIKQVWGGFNWNRRQVIVHYQGKQIIASMSAMPHAGRDDKPTNAWVDGRAGGYGTGTNLDAVHGNGMDGHMDIHFLNSTRHKDGKSDSGHQANIKSLMNHFGQ